MNQAFHFRTFFCSLSFIHIWFWILCVIISSCSSGPNHRPSPLRSDSASIQGVKVYIEFSSPGVKDRKIFGKGPDYLIPYGELWRTGANNATFISFEADMLVDSLALDSGSYALFTIPNQDEWVVIFNKDWNQWGAYHYQDSLDALRVKVKPRYVDQKQERLLFYFADDSLKFRWDKVRWAIPVIPLP